MDSEEERIAEAELNHDDLNERGLLSLDGCASNLGLTDELSGKSSAKRKRIAAEQLEVLEEVFRTTHHPSLILRNRIAARLDLSLRSVQIWFQNRRAKAKKNGPQDPYEKESTLLNGTPQLSSPLSLGSRGYKEGDHSRLIEMLTSDESPNKRAKLQQELLRELEKEKQKKDANAKKALQSSSSSPNMTRGEKRERGRLKDKDKTSYSSSNIVSRSAQTNQLSLSVTSTVINYNAPPPSSLPLQYPPLNPNPSGQQSMNNNFHPHPHHNNNNSHNMSSEEQFRQAQLDALQNHIRFDGPTSPLNFSSNTTENEFSVDSFYNSYGEPSSSYSASRPQSQRDYHASEQHYSNPNIQSQHANHMVVNPHPNASVMSYPQYSASGHQPQSYSHTPYSHPHPLHSHNSHLPHNSHNSHLPHHPQILQPSPQSYTSYTPVKEEPADQQASHGHQQPQHLVLTSNPPVKDATETRSATPSSNPVYLMVKNEPFDSSSSSGGLTTQLSHPSSAVMDPSPLTYAPLNYSVPVNSSPFLESN
eukprot:TRINITY_DN1318_c0_g1_i1.p1 TRINITY_DN1318_c0_g1~~TRINITY_DN1318_c0_g1_i1.p1  ORF type:complete len:532 (-),score=87.92 TRINITY_DN1318_c0_g1_i1:44-1639(-)